MLTKEQKKKILETIQKNLKENKLIVFCNFEGISIAKEREIRKKFKEIKGKIKVIKRRLLERALIGEKLSFPKLKGSIMMGMAKDEILPLKIIHQFPKEKKEKLEFIFGILREKEKFEHLTKEELEELATLPSKEEILGKLIFDLKTITIRLRNIFQGNTRNFIYILSQLSKVKE